MFQKEGNGIGLYDEKEGNKAKKYNEKGLNFF